MIDYDTLEMVCGEAGKALHDVVREADLTKPGDAELVKNLVGIMYKADLLNENSEYSQRGYSRDGDWYAEGNYSRDGNNSSYNRGTSYRRSRDSRGRYSRMNGFSRDGMMEHIDAMMQEAETEEQREKIRRFKEQLM